MKFKFQARLSNQWWGIKGTRKLQRQKYKEIKIHIKCKLIFMKPWFRMRSNNDLKKRSQDTNVDTKVNSRFQARSTRRRRWGKKGTKRLHPSSSSLSQFLQSATQPGLFIFWSNYFYSYPIVIHNSKSWLNFFDLQDHPEPVWSDSYGTLWQPPVLASLVTFHLDTFSFLNNMNHFPNLFIVEHLNSNLISYFEALFYFWFVEHLIESSYAEFSFFCCLIIVSFLCPPTSLGQFDNLVSHFFLGPFLPLNCWAHRLKAGAPYNLWASNDLKIHWKSTIIYGSYIFL